MSITPSKSLSGEKSRKRKNSKEGTERYKGGVKKDVSNFLRFPEAGD